MVDMQVLVGGLVRYSPTGVIVAAEGDWAPIIGWSAGELVGRVGLEMVHPDDLPVVVARLREGRGSVGLAVRWRHKDGRWVVLSWSSLDREGEAWAHAVPVPGWLVSPDGNTAATVIDEDATPVSSRRPTHGENTTMTLEDWRARCLAAEDQLRQARFTMDALGWSLIDAGSRAAFHTPQAELDADPSSMSPQTGSAPA